MIDVFLCRNFKNIVKCCIRIKKIDNVDLFIEELKLLECPGGTISLNVNPDGEVTKCAFNKRKIGNINTDSLKDIWFRNYDSSVKHNVANFEIIDEIGEHLKTILGKP